MYFSPALIALVATTVLALPAEQWANQKASTTAPSTPNDREPNSPTTAAWAPVQSPNAGRPAAATTPGKPAKSTPAGGQSQEWSNAKVKNTNNKSPSPTPVQRKIEASPSPNPIFKPAATSLPAVLGSNPSDTCTWEFILTCVGQTSDAGDVCLTPFAESSTNCFSDSTCAAKIGDNAPTCASCFNSVGKQTFVSACYKTKSDSNVKPVFDKLVSAGVCNDQGVVQKA